MKQKLSFKEYIYVASMLFGMFFGAGNLIFPVYMGQVAGRNMWAAVLGFLITGVGLPLLGVAALGISRSNGLFDLSHKVGRPYAFFFTCALYLTIGPQRKDQRHSEKQQREQQQVEPAFVIVGQDLLQTHGEGSRCAPGNGGKAASQPAELF